MISIHITRMQASGNHFAATTESPHTSDNVIAVGQPITSTAPAFAYSPLSRAEDTIRREQFKKKRVAACPAGFEQKFVVVNGLQYPCHPADPSKHSQFPVDFRGCYGCGGQHNYSDCPTKRKPECYNNFHWNLHCHKPEIYFKKRHRESNFPHQLQGNALAPYIPATPSNQHVHFAQPPPPGSNLLASHSHYAAIGRGRGTATPAWLSTPVPTYTGSARVPPPPPLPPRPSDEEGSLYSSQPNNFAQEYVQFLDLHTMSKVATRPMPITTRNELPHIKFSLKSKTNNDVIAFSMLYDTGAALNTGYLPYHMNIINKHPSIVARFEKFDGENPFDPIKLCGAITDPAEYKETKHGILSAVVEYHTPYCCGNDANFKLSLALGDSMSVNSILGLPTIISGNIEPKWQKKLYLSHTFQMKFPMVLQSTKRA